MRNNEMPSPQELQENRELKENPEEIVSKKIARLEKLGYSALLIALLLLSSKLLTKAEAAELVNQGKDEDEQVQVDQLDSADLDNQLKDLKLPGNQPDSVSSQEGINATINGEIYYNSDPEKNNIWGKVGDPDGYYVKRGSEIIKIEDYYYGINPLLIDRESGYIFDSAGYELEKDEKGNYVIKDRFYGEIKIKYDKDTKQIETIDETAIIINGEKGSYKVSLSVHNGQNIILLDGEPVKTDKGGNIALEEENGSSKIDKAEVIKSGKYKGLILIKCGSDSIVVNPESKIIIEFYDVYKSQE